jgi:hypothetical protein
MQSLVVIAQLLESKGSVKGQVGAVAVPHLKQLFESNS